MSASDMIVGKITGAARTHDRRSSGKVTFFKLRVANGSSLEFWSVAVFEDEARAMLDGLPEGFPLCATGEFSVEPWERDNKRGFNLKLIANSITRLSAKKRPPRPAKPKQTPRQSWATPLKIGEPRD